MAVIPLRIRVRITTLTPKGRGLHDQILEMALERERALLSVLIEAEPRDPAPSARARARDLAAVEMATDRYVAKRYPRAVRRRPRTVEDAAE